jgi:hypothetical protein
MHDFINEIYMDVDKINSSTKNTSFLLDAGFLQKQPLSANHASDNYRQLTLFREAVFCILLCEHLGVVIIVIVIYYKGP